jgi:hypothetical protein
MFTSTSRYASAETVTVATTTGATLAAVRLPVRPQPPVRGAHRRTEGQRLDQIASHYLRDATAFWRLCDAAGALAPDALVARDVVEIPDGGGRP